MINFKLAKETNLVDIFGEKGSCDCGGEHFLPAVKLFSYRGASERLCEVVRELNPVGKVLIVGVEDVGIYFDEVESLLSDYVVERAVLPRFASVSEEELSRLSVPEEARLVVAVGSGVATDYAKIIAKRLDVPLVLFVTALSFDTMFEKNVKIRRRFVLTKEEGKLPQAVIVDHDIIADNDDRFFAAAIGLAATEYLTIFDCYTREKFLGSGAKVCPNIADMLVFGVDKVVDAGEELKSGSGKAVERFVDGMLRIAAARGLFEIDLTNSASSTMQALYILKKHGKERTNELYGVKKFELYLKIINVIALFYDTKTIEETLPPDMDFRNELLTKYLGIDEWAAEKITSQIISPKAYFYIKKKVDETREYFADTSKEMLKRAAKATEVFSLFAKDLETEEKEDIYKSMVCSTEVCGSFTTLTVMKYSGLLEKYDKK